VIKGSKAHRWVIEVMRRGKEREPTLRLTGVIATVGDDGRLWMTSNSILPSEVLKFRDWITETYEVKDV